MLQELLREGAGLEPQMHDVTLLACANVVRDEFSEQVEHLLVRVHHISLKPANSVSHRQTGEHLKQESAQSAVLKFIVYGDGYLSGVRSFHPHITRSANEPRIVWGCDQPDDAGLFRPIYVQHSPQLVGRNTADGTEEAMQQGFAGRRTDSFTDEGLIVRAHMPETHQQAVIQRPFGAPIRVIGTRRSAVCLGTIHGPSIAGPTKASSRKELLNFSNHFHETIHFGFGVIEVKAGTSSRFHA